jgi:outer membrane receptor for ferrienterochelin and colicins
MFNPRYRAATRGVAGVICLLVVTASITPAVFASEEVAAADAAPAPTDAPAGAASSTDSLQTVVVTARHLNEVRSGIETQTGASTYTISSEAIESAPGGANAPLNQVLLQAPGVVQDSFGQIHVRGDHNDLQYRLNGIILPEGISVFSQTLSARLISSLNLVTGALPAEYGLRTAGIIDLTTNGGLLQPGGEVSLYGGSHGTFQPSAEYGGSVANWSYYVTGDYKETDIGIESPDSSSEPLHDHSKQYHAFGYFENVLDAQNRLSLIAGTSNEKFQIPNQRGLQPDLGYSVEGQTDYLSNDLDENQRELATYAILSWSTRPGP